MSQVAYSVPGRSAAAASRREAGRILVTLLHEMRRRDAGRGIATLCVGGGQGQAAIIRNGTAR